MTTERRNRRALNKRIKMLKRVDNRFRVRGHPSARKSRLLSSCGADDHAVFVMERFVKKFPTAMIGIGLMK